MWNGNVFYGLRNHARASQKSRAAKRASNSAVTPFSRALSVDRTADHHSAGILSLCHHLETTRLPAPTSLESASRESQSSTTERNEVKSDIAPLLRQSVLNCKDVLTADFFDEVRQTVPMIGNSLFKQQFLARTALARERSGRSQEDMAKDLGISQGTYHKYETRTPLPHSLIPAFCTLCRITMEWLYTAAVELPEPKPRAPRRRRKIRKVA